ncbi:MAG: hypothetical protein ACREAB_20980 [Blastocatellia bacterium]
MGRRRDERNVDHFDLLPFIAILMCVLGCLLLVTLSVAALSLGAGAGEGWIPVPDRERAVKTPVLIEWDGKVATIHRQGRKIQAKWEMSELSRIRIGGEWYTLSGLDEKLDPELKKLLDELESRRATHYALFAVRPSGFDNFERFANQFRSRQIDVGYEPIKQQKPVRLLGERRAQ